MENEAMSDAITHAIIGGGESTEKWAFRQSGFMGSLKQLICCARCGMDLPVTPLTCKRHYYNIGKPTFHVLCESCYESLPE